MGLGTLVREGKNIQYVGQEETCSVGCRENREAT
jgi:hypothetical protein